MVRILILFCFLFSYYRGDKATTTSAVNQINFNNRPLIGHFELDSVVAKEFDLAFYIFMKIISGTKEFISGYVFKTTDPNGKIYIAQCARGTPEETKDYYGTGGKIYQEALRFFGKANFTKEILIRDLLTQRRIDIYETIYQIKFDALNPGIGYNIVKGPARGFGDCNPIHVEGVVERATNWLEECRDNSLIAKRPNRSASYTEEDRLAIGLKMKEANTGRIWITNKIENKLVKPGYIMKGDWDYGFTRNGNSKSKRQDYKEYKEMNKPKKSVVVKVKVV